MKKLPNTISMLRLILSPYVFILTYRGEVEMALGLFVILALSDAVDGALARLLKAVSNLGKMLDPIADKVLLFFGLLSITFYTELKTSPYLIQLLVARDLFLVGGTLILRRFGFVPEPSPLGKATTFLVSLTVLTGFVCNISPKDFLLKTFEVLEVISIALILISALDYGVRGLNFILSKLIIEKR